MYVGLRGLRRPCDPYLPTLAANTYCHLLTASVRYSLRSPGLLALTWPPCPTPTPRPSHRHHPAPPSSPPPLAYSPSRRRVNSGCLSSTPCPWPCPSPAGDEPAEPPEPPLPDAACTCAGLLPPTPTPTPPGCAAVPAGGGETPRDLNRVSACATMAAGSEALAGNSTVVLVLASWEKAWMEGGAGAREGIRL